jgi:hypothetical protein
MIVWLKGLVKTLGATTDVMIQDGDTAGTIAAHVKGINEAANSTTAVNVNKQGSASGSLTKHRIVLAGTTNAQCPKAAAGQVYYATLSNFSATAFVMKFSDLATAPTPGTTPVVWSVYVPATQTVHATFPEGLPFSNGIAYCVTRGAADSDTTATTASDGYVNIGYA